MPDRSVLARLERIIQDRIAAKIEVDGTYDFMAIKRSVLNENRNDLGNERAAYSSELSKRFGAEGGKKSAQAKKKRAAEKRAAERAEDILIEEARRAIQIEDAAQLILEERIRSGQVEEFREARMVIPDDMRDAEETPPAENKKKKRKKK